MHAGATWVPAALFALLSAALFAGNSVAVRLALAGTTATTIVVVSILTNLTTLWVGAALPSPPPRPGPPPGRPPPPPRRPRPGGPRARPPPRAGGRGSDLQRAGTG